MKLIHSIIPIAFAGWLYINHISPRVYDCDYEVKTVEAVNYYGLEETITIKDAYQKDGKIYLEIETLNNECAKMWSAEWYAYFLNRSTRFGFMAVIIMVMAWQLKRQLVVNQRYLLEVYAVAALAFGEFAIDAFDHFVKGDLGKGVAFWYYPILAATYVLIKTKVWQIFSTTRG